MPILIELAAVLSIVIAILGLLSYPPRAWRLWTATMFLLAGISFFVVRQRTGADGFVKLNLDRNSVAATFVSISAEGSQRQLVFHYTVENKTNNTFRIDVPSCSMVSFRFAEKTHDVAVPRAQSNPALNLLEKDTKAYSQFAGLVRLPTTQPALTLDPCPLKWLPKQSRAVAIAIPYACPSGADQNPNSLRLYVRAFMPQIEGFGVSNPAQNYEIQFPRAW
jgi:hypothetical protein